MSLAASDCANDYAQRLRSLPPLPDVAQQIIQKMNDEFVDGNTVADIVAQDPAVAARLIGVGNSAYFGLPEPVADMRQIVNQVLGVDTVRSMAIALATQSLVSTEECPAFDSTRFWRRSLSVGISAQRIAYKMGEISATEQSFSYLLGLCHNLGLLVFANLEPERLQNVLLDSDDDEPLDVAIRQEFGTAIGELTLALCRHWRLPETLLAAYESANASVQPADGLPLVLHAAINATRNVTDAANDDNAGGTGSDDGIEAWEVAGALSDRERETVDQAVRALGR